MAVKPISKIGDPQLREISQPIIKFDSKELRELEQDLKDTLLSFRKKTGYGRGISAIQIGIPKRAIYIKSKDFEGLLCDPVILSKSTSTFPTWDSCFSADAAFFVKIQRHLEVEVEYYTSKGKKKILIAQADLAELLQHEIDHLDGILCIDYVNNTPNGFLMREVFEKTIA